ncbi:outer membrane usher protein FimD/PapC [Paenibacillus shirakamiensis]|uniref:Outer membrane usher protein FimD/PapC n=1 Tax=Paenibacillus shirakamiensis TaxID=1265935 RepID=A0ABS4JEP8_9BACL|nr:GerMN domain-containing protein [Paenibacillus shirakamiensis]MBP1999606.1 outer membrane usher protein FimD/PapC [Paenibacillus shirakamiensis]
MNKKMGLATLILLTTLTVSGCGQKPKEAAPAPNNEVTQAQGEAPVTPQKEPEVPITPEVPSTTPVKTPSTTSSDKDTPTTNEVQKKTLSIQVYYTDDQMMELKEAKREISYEDSHEKYEAAFKALQTSGDAKLFSLWEKIKLKSLKFKSGELTLDIHIPDEARLGAGGESYALDSLRKTYFQFDEIKSIELLVDGAQVDSLMGHADLDHPLKR